jgi:PAS domain S-box-containing protein
MTELCTLAADELPRGDGHRVERRRSSQHGQSPMTTLRQLPALVVLERIPVPMLAIGDDGAIPFANTAFAEMMGYAPDEVLSLRVEQIFAEASDAEPALAVVHTFANLVVALAHNDGSTVRALMSKSALRRCDDRVALATFYDLTEQLWVNDR